ncbi:hypothetical protein ACFLUJ_06105 [Chloroflexota bacterium]
MQSRAAISDRSKGSYLGVLSEGAGFGKAVVLYWEVLSPVVMATDCC